MNLSEFIEAIRFAHPERSEAALREEFINAEKGVLDPASGNRDSREFQEALEKVHSEIIFKYLPHETFAPGTIGHLLAEEGSFLRGMSVLHGPTKLTIVDTVLEWRATFPNSNQVTYGVVLEVEHEDRKEKLPFVKGDHYENIRSMLQKKVERNDTGLLEQLRAWANAYAEYFSAPSTDPIAWVLNPHNELPSLLVHLLQQPRPDSFVKWAQTALNINSFKPLKAQYKGHEIMLTVNDYAPPRASFSSMESTIAFSVQTSAPREDDSFWGPPWMYLGFVEDAWLERNGPTKADELAYVEMLLAKWHEDTTYQFEYFLKKNGFQCLSGGFWQYNMPSFWILDLLTFFLENGPPSAPPVPPFTRADITRACTIVRRANDETKHDVLRQMGNATSKPLAIYDLNGYTLVLADDRNRHIPFYAFSILLRPPGADHFITILMNDVWNPQAARVIDGDAFALRRLVEWLRAAIKKNKLNERITFEGEDEDEDRTRKTSIWITDWLLLNQPEPKEELLVDWRCQRYITNPGPDNGIACFSGIYGFTSAYQKRILDVDIPAWRKFLCDVIDKRFDYPWGKK